MESSENVKYALLLAGDILGKTNLRSIRLHRLDEKDNDAKLFGNAGTAWLLKKTDKVSPRMDMALRTDGSGFRAIIAPYSRERHMYENDTSTMNGEEVFNFAIDKPPALIRELMEKIGTAPQDYDCLVLHQANQFIMKQIVKRSGFSPDQSLISIDRFGNTSSASITTALTKYYGDDDGGSVKAMLCGFGVGLSWSAVSLEIEKRKIIPLIQTDEAFDDGYPELEQSTSQT